MTLHTSLQAHPWVDEAHAGHASACASGIVVRLSPVGVSALRRHGRQTLLDALQGELSAPVQPENWRLFDRWPDDFAPENVDALLHRPRPTDAELLAEHRDGGDCTLQLRVPLDLVHFDGHFPRAPILPGAVQIAWALTLAAPRLGTPPHCRQMEVLKFQHLLRPGDRVELLLHHDATRHKLHFAYRLGELACSSGRLLWDPAA